MQIVEQNFGNFFSFPEWLFALTLSLDKETKDVLTLCL